MLHQIEEPCSLGAHAGVIIPPSWIIKVRKPQVTTHTEANTLRRRCHSDSDEARLTCLWEVLAVIWWELTRVQSVWGSVNLSQDTRTRLSVASRARLQLPSPLLNPSILLLCSRARWRTLPGEKRGRLSNGGQARRDWMWVMPRQQHCSFMTHP